MEINWINVLIGIVSIGYGFYIIRLRNLNPEKLTKLDKMKEHWGDNAGSKIHLIAYVIIPIFIGIAISISGILGYSLLS